MENQEEKNNIVAEADVKEENNSVAVEVAGDNSDSKKPFLKKNFKSRKPRMKPERQKSEFDQKIIDIRRVTRVVKGGRRFSFSVAMILGNRKGSVGVGLGKASDTSLAIDKAMRDAKRKMVRVKLTKDMTIPHEVSAKYCASDVVIRPAKGRGVVAGSSLRSVLELAGVKEVGGKVLSRSKNKINNARAAIKALSKLK